MSANISNNNDSLPTLRFTYDDFFTLTERTKQTNHWTIDDLNDNEKAIIQIALNYYEKQFNDIEQITTSLTKKNSLIQLLIKFKDTIVEELIVIRRINNTKFKISIDDLKEQREVIIGYVKTKHSLYK